MSFWLFFFLFFIINFGIKRKKTIIKKKKKHLGERRCSPEIKTKEYRHPITNPESLGKTKNKDRFAEIVAASISRFATT